MTETQLTYGPHTMLAFLPQEKARAEIVCVCGVEDARAIAGSLPPDAALLAMHGVDWNRELSPWPADKCFKGGEAFAGEAPAFLQQLLGRLPQAEAAFGLYPGTRVLAGYSLAGLFALWAFCETDVFTAAVSASGSLWFDGFDDYLTARLPQRPGAAVYLSLGDAEEKTRNPRLAAVGDATRAVHTLLLERGMNATLQWNHGGHFQNPPERLSRGIGWVLQQI